MSEFCIVLQTEELSDMVSPVETLSERVRNRIREEMQNKHLSQRDLGALMVRAQSYIGQRLSGRVQISLDDAALFADALGMGVTELLRDRGYEFCAEMTPTEMRLLERFRALPADRQAAWLKVITIGDLEPRRALPQPIRKKKTGSG